MTKKSILITTILAAALSLALNSCKDDPAWVSQIPVSNPNASELLPMTIGNYWIFYAWDYNANFQKINSSLTTDSLVVVGTKLIDGRSAWIVEHYSDNDLKDSMLFSINETTIMRYLTVEDSLPPDIAPRWVIIYKKNAEYEVDCYHSFIEKNKQFFDIKLNALIKSGAQFSRYFDTTIVFAGKEYKTIQMKHTIQHMEEYGIQDCSFQKIYYYSTFYNFYQGIGLMSLKINPYSWNYIFPTIDKYKNYNSWSEHFNGKVYSLLRYRVK